MGTRADFYVGRGPKAEWLGSIAWDGYPQGTPEPLLKIEDEKAFRVEVANIIEENRGTKPEMGWPWPWDNSNTTDYAYAFDEGRVWGTCFGYGWWPADKEHEEDECDERVPKISDWPDMKERRNMPALGSARSGIILITSP